MYVLYLFFSFFSWWIGFLPMIISLIFSSVKFFSMQKFSWDFFWGCNLRVLFGKQRIVHLWGVRVPALKERPQPVLAPSFYTFCLLPAEPDLCKLGLARKRVCLFHLRFSLWSWDFSFVPFSRALPFLCLSFSHCHFGLLFPILTK